MKENYIIGIDAGTSITKAVLFDLGGNEIFKTEVQTNISSPFIGWIETEMNGLWKDTKKCLKELILKSKISHNDIIGIGLTGPGDGTWMIDHEGNPIRPGIYWCDGRAEKIIQKWFSDGTAERAFEICGTSVNTGSQCAQIKWLKENEPKTLRTAKTIFHCKDWLYYKFTGKITSDESDESLGLFDIKKRKYEKELFELFEINEYFDKYPVVQSSDKNRSKILTEVAKELGLNKDLMVASGPMDVVSCALGGGAIYHGQACSIIGTASIHEVITDTPIISPKMVGMTLCHAHKSKWIRLMAAMAATPNIDWFIKEFGYKYEKESKKKGIPILKYLEEVISNVPLGCEGVLYHPYILPGGERAPFVAPNARANFSGITISHSIDHVIRSIYEGIGFSMLDCYMHMPISIGDIILTGGGSKSSTWCQIIADITGKIIRIPRGEEFGAKGAMLNFGVALGIYDGFEDAVSKTVDIAKSYFPNTINTKKYNEIYKIYKMTYKKMIDVWDLRSSIRKGDIKFDG